MLKVLGLSLALATLVAPHLARAGAEGVGLGVAAGLAYSNNAPLVQEDDEVIGARFAWGFFVDIPLLETFYITPSTMIYQIDAYGAGETPVTDVDLNFKFIVPLGSASIGAGITAGLSVGVEPEYVPHWGVLAYGSMNLVANLDAFVQYQYKQLMPEELDDIQDNHLFAGAMFHF